MYIPKSFDLLEIIKLVLSVLGLTWQNIRAKLVKIIPEPVLVVLEKTAGILVTLVKDGPAAAWQEIKNELTELKDQLIAKITEMVSVEVVKAAVMKLATMLNPAGAVIQAIIAIYKTIMFFIEKINQIAAVVGAFIDSIASIAAGQIDNAAKKVEQTMANTLTLIISFLAKLLGLGNIPEKLTGIIKKIRQPIDKGLDKIVGWLGGMLQKLGSAAKGAITAFFAPKSFKVGAVSHKLYPDGNGVAMVASEPERLEKAFNRLGGNVALVKELDKVNQNLKNASDPAKKTELQKEADKLTVKIVDELVKLKYGEGTKDTMPLVKIAFTIMGNPDEFKRQIAMQQTVLKGMKVGEWQRNRARFIGFGRDEKRDTDSARKESIVAKLISNPTKGIEALGSQGLLSSADQALVGTILTDANIKDKNKALASTVKRIMDTYGSKNLAVLHTLDQVAGGASNIYGDDATVLGGSYENSRIGGQWKNKISLVDTAAKEIKADADVNVTLTT